jgi:hypothetical protein
LAASTLTTKRKNTNQNTPTSTKRFKQTNLLQSCKTPRHNIPVTPLITVDKPLENHPCKIYDTAASRTPLANVPTNQISSTPTRRPLSALNSFPNIQKLMLNDDYSNGRQFV